MSYNNNGYGQQQGYGQYNPYGQSGNPYSAQQQGNPYGGQQQQGNYSNQPAYGHQGTYADRPDLDHQTSSRYDGSRYDEESQQGGYEMGNINSRDPNRLLNDIRTIDRDITTVEGKMETLRREKSSNSDLQSVSAQTDSIYNTIRGLLERGKIIKADPERNNPRNKAQAGKLERRLQGLNQDFRSMQEQFQRDSEAQIERDVRTINPAATDEEVRAAVASGQSQVFSQALMSSDRRGQAQSALANARSRHEAIQRIERQMEELAKLFNEMEAVVIQQEPAVTNIEQKGEEVTQDVAKANTELDGAVKKARAARKKKWICFGIVVLIILILALGIGLGVGIAVHH